MFCFASVVVTGTAKALLRAWDRCQAASYSRRLARVALRVQALGRVNLRPRCSLRGMRAMSCTRLRDLVEGRRLGAQGPSVLDDLDKQAVSGRDATTTSAAAQPAAVSDSAPQTGESIASTNVAPCQPVRSPIPTAARRQRQHDRHDRHRSPPDPTSISLRQAASTPNRPGQ
jgi:hypothetical protein